jgi:8-oxo-dGTP pyrophosphatase MutT (NUDIX family)
MTSRAEPSDGVAEPVPGHITAAGMVVYRPSRGFLLIRNRDYWEFPKGRLEESKDANLVATAVREIGEETGLTDVTLVDGFHEVERYRVQRGPKDVHMYLGMTAQEPKISHEHRGYCWVYPYEINKFITYETKMVIFRKALAHLRAQGLLRPEDEIKPGRSLRPPHKPHGGRGHGKSGAQKK